VSNLDPIVATTTPNADREHAWASPSSLARVFACPASPGLAAAMPPEARATNGAAFKGEQAHQEGEGHLRAWTDPLPGSEFEDVLVPYLAAVRAALGPVALSGPESSGRELLIENRVAIAGEDCHGSYDAAVVDRFDCSLDVFDLKSGVHVPAAAMNLQLGAYAIGLLKLYAGRPIEWKAWVVRLHIVGARRLDGAPVVDTWATTGEWCAGLLKRITAAIKSARKVNAPAIAGDHCAFCRAAPQCPAKLAQAASVFPLATLDAPTGDEPGERIGEPTPPSLLPPAFLARVLTLEKDIVAWLKSCREYALLNPPPGWKLVAGRKGDRAWINPAAAVEALARAAIPAFGPAPIRTPADVEKKVGKATFAVSFGNLIMQPPGGPTLALDSDPRPAFSLGSAFPVDVVDDAK